MNVLLTGAFGNVGQSTLEGLLERGHRVRTFDLPTPANRKTAERYRGLIDPAWGDLRTPDDLAAAVSMADGLDSTVHLGFVIPRLSATGVNSEDQPDFSRSVNIGGTRNLIHALRGLEPKPRLVFASSLHVFGRTQHLAPPRGADDPPSPVEHYARHKVEAEEMVRSSGLEWSILRIGACLPVRLILDPGMFDVPLDNRIEFIHTRDAGAAFAAAVDCRRAAGKILLLGGGPRCKLYYREMMGRIMDVLGIGPLPGRCFTRVPYSVDWLDTRESQDLLHYQQRTFDDYITDLIRALGPLRGLAKAIGPLVRSWLIARSPYTRETCKNCFLPAALRYNNHMPISRRSFLRAALLSPAALLMPACGLAATLATPTTSPAEQVETDPEVVVIAEGLAFPEGPAFDPQGRLWCTELGSGNLVRIAEGELARVPTGGNPNGLAFDYRGRAWVTDSKQMAVRRYSPDSEQWETLLDQIDGKPLQSPNDLCFDSQGSLVFTCPNFSTEEPTGYIACLFPDGSARQVGASFYRPNGLDFISVGKALLVADTYQKKIFKGPWDAEKGLWLDPQPWAEAGGSEGPDGMAAGADGLLYQAVFGDGVIRVVDSDGRVVREIKLPGRNPTNAAIDPSGKLGLVVTETEKGQLLSIPSIQPGMNIYDGAGAWG